MSEMVEMDLLNEHTKGMVLRKVFVNIVLCPLYPTFFLLFSFFYLSSLLSVLLFFFTLLFLPISDHEDIPVFIDLISWLSSWMYYDDFYGQNTDLQTECWILCLYDMKLDELLWLK